VQHGRIARDVRPFSESQLQTARVVLITILACLVALLCLVLLFIYSGRYEISATTPHSGFGRWVLNTIQERSIHWHAERSGIDVPPISGEQLQHGIEHFAHMCVPCHGAPGVERGEYGKGITPTPPDLAQAARQWDAAELFWIVKHGIKLAGMPAFGTTHTDEQLWGIVAFVQQLPNLSAAEYQRVARQRGANEETIEASAQAPLPEQ